MEDLKNQLFEKVKQYRNDDEFAEGVLENIGEANYAKMLSFIEFAEKINDQITADEIALLSVVMSGGDDDYEEDMLESKQQRSSHNMINILFSGSAEGSLRASGMCKKTDFICTVDLMLDVGYIDVPIDDQYRRDLYSQMYWYGFPWVDDTDCRMDEYFDKSIKAIQKIVKKVKHGEDVRIWKDITPSGLCTFYYICKVLNDLKMKNKVIVKEVPKHADEENEILAWALCDASIFDEVAEESSDRILTSEEIEEYANKWNALANAHCKLRSIVDGDVSNVAEDFYDDEILNGLTEKGMNENEVRGNFLCQSSVIISSLIPAWRIDEMIKQGRIKVVKEETVIRNVCNKVRQRYISKA